MNHRKILVHIIVIVAIIDVAAVVECFDLGFVIIGILVLVLVLVFVFVDATSVILAKIFFECVILYIAFF